MKLGKPLRERVREVVRPRWELARFDVVNLNGIVGESKDEDGGVGGVEGEGVNGMREGREDAFVLKDAKMSQDNTLKCRILTWMASRLNICVRDWSSVVASHWPSELVAIRVTVQVFLSASSSSLSLPLSPSCSDPASISTSSDVCFLPFVTRPTVAF